MEHGTMIRRELGKGTNVPPERLDRWARHGSRDFQIGVAQNPKAWDSTLDYLAKLGDEEIIYALQHNPSTSAETLDYLANRK